MTPKDLKKWAAWFRSWATRNRSYAQEWRERRAENLARELEDEADKFTVLATLCESLAEPTQEMLDAAMLGARAIPGSAKDFELLHRCTLHAMLAAIKMPK